MMPSYGYNGEDSSAVWDTTKKNSCIVGYNERKFVKHPEIIP
jgi:hypothetical protein